MPAGRPTKYNDELLKAAKDYIDNFQPVEGQEIIPTVVGMCIAVNISHAIAYKWAKDEDKKEFLDILEKIEGKQHKELVNRGLDSTFNPTITKMMLTKHGYSDKQEIDHTSKGDRVEGINVTFVESGNSEE